MKVLLVLAACVICVYGKVTPDFFPTCKRGDPEIEKCVLEGIEALRPRLKAGIPEIHIPALEPFILPTLKLDKTASNLKLKATIKQGKAFGGSRFRIDKIRFNLNDKYVGEVKLFLPKLAVITDYDVKGSKLLNFDINGKGRLRGNFTGITVVAKGNAKPIEKDGVVYLQADKIITKIKIGHGHIALDNTERPLAAVSAATFFNASPGTVFDILTPLIEETCAAVLKNFINKVFGTVPLNELLSDA